MSAREELAAFTDYELLAELSRRLADRRDTNRSRDVSGELTRLFADGVWRITDEITHALDCDYGAAMLALSSSPEFVRLADGRLVGRKAQAKPWGSSAMARALFGVPS